MRCTGTVLLACIAVMMPFSDRAASFPEIEVDCDRGDNLAEALDRINESGQGQINVRGTCVGAFEVTARGVVRILGESPDAAVIQGSLGSALSARDSGRLDLHDLTLMASDITAVRAQGAGRLVRLFGCEIRDSANGLELQGGAGLQMEQTLIHSNSGPAILATNADIYMFESTIRNNGDPARIRKTSLELFDTVVEDHDFGILAYERSNVIVTGGRLARNGFGHLALLAGCQAVLNNPSIGSAKDETAFSIHAEDGGAVKIVGNETPGEIWGSATLLGDSFISIENTTFNGSIHLRDFSRLKLNATVQDGMVDCGSAADAWCGPSGSAVATDCPGIDDPCTASIGSREDLGATESMPGFPAKSRIPSLSESFGVDPRKPEGRRHDHSRPPVD